MQVDQAVSIPASVSAAPSRLVTLLHRPATWVLLDQAITSAGNFLTANLLVRNLPSSQWGVFTVIFETLLYLNSLQAAVVIYPLLVRGARDSASVSRLATASILLTVALLPILGAATVLSTGFVAGFHTALCAVVALVLWQIQETTRRALFSQLRFADAVWGDAISYVGRIVFIVIAARMNLLTLNAVFLGIGLASALATVLQAFQLRLQPIRLRHLRLIAEEFWALGRWVLLNNAGGLITGLSYWWVLQGFHGEVATAAAGAIIVMLKLANPIITSLGTLIVPAVARASACSGAASTVPVAMRYILLGALLLAPYFLLLGLLPEQSMRLFYGYDTQYHVYGFLLTLFVLNYTMKFVADVVGEWLMGLGRARQSFYSQIVNILATLLIGLPLTWLWGIHGFIIGGMIAAGCTAIGTVYYLRLALRGK